MLLLAASDAEAFARAANAAQRGHVRFTEQGFAALVGQLLANEAPHAMVRCALNFGLEAVTRRQFSLG